MLATYEHRKGHELLFNSIEIVHRNIPNVYFIICGDGTPEEVLEVDDLRKNITPTSNTYLHGFIQARKN